MVHNPARCADDDLYTPTQLTQLHGVTLAAIDRQDVKIVEKTCIGLHGLGDLDGQFAGRCQHQQLRHASRHVYTGQQRQCESGRLAGPGLRLAEDIVPIKQKRYAGRLDRRRGLVAGLGYRPCQRFGQIEIGKRNGSLGFGHDSQPGVDGAVDLEGREEPAARAGLHSGAIGDYNLAGSSDRRPGPVDGNTPGLTASGSAFPGRSRNR